MKVFEFHKDGSVSLIENDFIYIALSPDEITELVRDYHRDQIERVGRLAWLRQWLSLITLIFEQRQ